jgi:hypothetical protein
MTPEELELLPKLIEYWEQRAKAVRELSGIELLNAQIAICEARRALRAAQKVNAEIADRMRER